MSKNLFCSVVHQYCSLLSVQGSWQEKKTRQCIKKAHNNIIRVLSGLLIAEKLTVS